MRAYIVVMAVVMSGCSLAYGAGAAEGLAGGVRAVQVSGESCIFLAQGLNGLNRNCVYQCPSGQATLTVQAYNLCPLIWKRAQ